MRRASVSSQAPKNHHLIVGVNNETEADQFIGTHTVPNGQHSSSQNDERSSGKEQRKIVLGSEEQADCDVSDMDQT